QLRPLLQQPHSRRPPRRLVGERLHPRAARRHGGRRRQTPPPRDARHGPPLGVRGGVLDRRGRSARAAHAETRRRGEKSTLRASASPREPLFVLCALSTSLPPRAASSPPAPAPAAAHRRSPARPATARWHRS